MNSSNMSQKIFDIGLSTETISVYLLCCGLEDSGAAISTKNLLEIWNGTKEALAEGLYNLEKRNILLKIISDRDQSNVYKMTDLKEWKLL